MLKKIIYVVLSIIVAYFVLCIIGPKKMDVTASKTLQASSVAIFSQIADLRNMKNWSKWILEDTAMKMTYGKTTSGIGGTYSWQSKKSGAGSMTIKNVDPNRMIAYDLTFKDWDAISDVKMELKPNGKTTDVTWTMIDQKESPFYLRGMMLVMNMNGRIKKDFNKGLDNLDQFLKANPNVTLMNGFNMDESRFVSTDYLLKRAVVKMSDISAFFATHLPEIGKLAAAHVKGAPSGIYWKWDEAGKQADMAAAMAVSDKNIANETYSVVNIPDSKEFVLHYYGSYDQMQTAHQTLDSIVKMHGYAYPELVIEEYITDPMTQKDTALWYTKIHYLVK